jgi:AraC-like DNA-binding protein
MPRRIRPAPAGVAIPLPPRVDRAAYRERFLGRVPSIRSFQQMFNQLPGMHFCVKDRRSRLVWGNAALFERLNVSEDQMTGTTDYQYFPRHIADSFVRDDQAVMRTGRPILNRVAVWYNEQRILDWFVKNKFPLRDAAGRIIGLIVSIQNYEGMHHAQTPFSELSRVIEHIRSHAGERIAVTDLARISGVSPRHLHRRFRRAFGLSVQEFLGKTRIQGAIDALIRTDRSISAIALESGFCDQSAFTRQFGAYTGTTPAAFRRQHSVEPARPS